MNKSVLGIAALVLVLAGIGGAFYWRGERLARIGALEIEAERALQAGNFSQALELSKALEVEDPHHGGAPIIAARAQLGGGHVTEAAAAWKVATERNPQSAEAAEGYGHALALAGDVVNARISLDRAISLDSQRLTTIARLAQLDVLQGHPEDSVKRLIALRAKRSDAQVDQIIKEHVGVLRSAGLSNDADALEAAMKK